MCTMKRVASFSRQPSLIQTSVGAVHVVAHVPGARAVRDTAVLLVPPFGWDDICSYRPRRDWADALAGEGYVAVRLTLPSCGDSAGRPDEPGRVATWATAVADTGRFVRETFARARMAVIGIEFGGLVVCHAIAEEMDVDDLVLWGTPATGRQYVRRMQAFANLELTADATAPDPVSDPAEGLSAGGFRLSEETIADLRALDVAAFEGLGRRVGRVMLLDRDELPPDNRLRTHLADTGAELSHDAGNGYSAMTAPSFEAIAPQATIARVSQWLAVRSRDDAAPITAAALHPGPTPFADRGTEIQETQIVLRGPHGPLAGIVTEPLNADPGGVCAVFLDSGTIRHVGANRLWVEAARRWAAVPGIRSVRFDLDGMGESDGDAEPYRDLSRLYAPWIVDQVTSVLEQLHAGGRGERFVLVGLSAGAYWAMHAAIADPRVEAIAMVNPGTLVWDPGQTALGDFRTMREIAQTRTISLATLRKAFGPRGLALAVWLVRAAIDALRRRRDAPPMLVGHADELREAVVELRGMSAHRLVVLCDEESLLLELEEAGLLDPIAATPGIHLERVATNDHTMRPLWAQRAVHAALDRMLAGVTGEPVVAPDPGATA